MANATYRFIVPGRYIGQTVTVFDQATGTQVASGAVGSDGAYSVALPQGDYYATTPDGLFLDADQSGPGAGSSDAASRSAGMPAASQPTDGRPYWLSNNVKDLRVSAAPGDRSTVLAPTVGWEGTAVQEPNVFYANGVYNMLYTGNVSTNAGIGWATAPTPSGPWTKQGTAPVLGQNHGGFAGSAQHSNLYVEAGTAYLFFTDNAGSVLRLATASLTDLSTWTTNAKTWPLPSGATQWGNTGIFKEADGTYTMVFEAFRTAWLIGIGTLGTSLTNDLTVQTSILTDLKVGSAGSTSNGQMFKDGSTYILYYHGAVYGSLPTDIYRATSTDKVTWTIDNGGYPMVTRTIANEIDQVADPAMVQTADGAWWMFWTGADNPASKFRINAAPMLPTLRKLDAATGAYVRTEAAGVVRPNRKQISVLTSDKTTSSTTLTDVGLTVDFIPTTTRAIVRLSAEVSNNTGSAYEFFAINCPNIGVTKDVFQTTPVTAGGVQVSGGREVLFTGLQPGVVQQFKAQWRVTGGTVVCRPGTLPTQEHMTLTAEDAGAVFGPNNA